MDKTIFGDDFSYLQSAVPTGVMAKQTIPSPNMVHYRGGPASIDQSVYPGHGASSGPTWPPPTPTRSPRLAALGCRYLQFDDTSLAYLNDPAQRADIAARGEDADHVHLPRRQAGVVELQVAAAERDQPGDLVGISGGQVGQNHADSLVAG